MGRVDRRKFLERLAASAAMMPAVCESASTGILQRGEMTESIVPYSAIDFRLAYSKLLQSPEGCCFRRIIF